MPHRTPLVCCPKCKGEGKIRLTKSLAHAFHYIRENPGRMVKDYHKHLCEVDGCPTPIAAQNRMNALCELMIVVRKKQSGRFRYYVADNTGPNAQPSCQNEPAPLHST